MQTRKPIVAGQFYPGQHEACVDQINECLDEITLPESLPETINAGIVPHAGWTFSGSLAAMVFLAVQMQNQKVHTFVIFGAAHSYYGPKPAVYESGFWETPLGEVAVDEDLAGAVLAGGFAESNRRAHHSEHSIEVQVPFIQYLFPGARILPIVVPPSNESIELGEAVGKIIAGEGDKKIVCIGSTDLTHYGPRYGFTPAGTGSEGLMWAENVNDKKFLDIALKMEPRELLSDAAEHCNACGPGAIAATISATKKLGSKKGVLLAYTNSNKVMENKMGTTSSDSVGYAAVVF